MMFPLSHGIFGAAQASTPSVDKMALLAALAAAAALDESDYTPESWAVLASAVTAGQAVYDDPDATQQQVDDATQAIADAIAALVPVPSVCTITLSGDEAPLLGLLPAEVDGRRVFIDAAPAEITTFAAFNYLSNPQPLLPGEQVSELSFEWSENDGTVSPALSLANADLSTVIVGAWGRSNDFVIFAQDSAGNIIPGTYWFIPNIQGTTTLALSVTGATGQVEAYIDGQPQGLSALNDFYADTFAGDTALNTGVTFEALPTVAVPFGVTLSVAAETMVSQYPAGLIDRCGNALPDIPVEGSQVFLGNGVFIVPPGVTSVDALIVGGGGGGGGSRYGSSNTVGRGGGGAGGVRVISLPVIPGESIPVVVGAGGAGGSTIVGDPGARYSANGGDSSFGEYVAVGGGGGGPSLALMTNAGADGGSGGGSGFRELPPGLGVPGQGSDGSVAAPGNASGGGGGGGAGGAAPPFPSNSAGSGGPGIDLTSIGWGGIPGAPSAVGGGGGGGAYDTGNGGAASHGGGAGGSAGYQDGAEATPNTGGGGGGVSGGGGVNEAEDLKGGGGGSGLVIVRWPSAPSVHSPAAVTTE